MRLSVLKPSGILARYEQKPACLEKYFRKAHLYLKKEELLQISGSDKNESTHEIL